MKNKQFEAETYASSKTKNDTYHKYLVDAFLAGVESMKEPEVDTAIPPNYKGLARHKDESRT